MSLNEVNSGRDIPNEVNVIVEIPMLGGPVKYEVDKESGTLMVDRFMAGSMVYPTNYGYIPGTLSEDGDPVDVLVVTPAPLVHAAVISCRLVGMLKMTDEAGIDAKLLAVPTNKVCMLYQSVQSYKDLPQSLLSAIEHFFNHYKDLEEGKWVKVEGWLSADQARSEVMLSVDRYNQKHK